MIYLALVEKDIAGFHPGKKCHHCYLPVYHLISRRFCLHADCDVAMATFTLASTQKLRDTFALSQAAGAIPRPKIRFRPGSLSGSNTRCRYALQHQGVPGAEPPNRQDMAVSRARPARGAGYPGTRVSPGYRSAASGRRRTSAALPAPHSHRHLPLAARPCVPAGFRIDS